MFESGQDGDATAMRTRLAPGAAPKCSQPGADGIVRALVVRGAPSIPDHVLPLVQMPTRLAQDVASAHHTVITGA